MSRLAAYHCPQISWRAKSLQPDSAVQGMLTAVCAVVTSTKSTYNYNMQNNGIQKQHRDTLFKQLSQPLARWVKVQLTIFWVHHSTACCTLQVGRPQHESWCEWRGCWGCPNHMSPLHHPLATTFVTCINRSQACSVQACKSWRICWESGCAASVRQAASKKP